MKKVIALCFFLSIFVAVSAFAQQDKVVVVPLNSSSKLTAAAAGGNQTLSVTTTTQTARSVTITAPTDGLIIVSASCYVELTASAGTNLLFRAYITDGTGLDTNAQLSYADTVNPSYTYSTVSGTRTFAVSAGTYTYNFNVNMYFSGTAILRDSHMNALFVPVSNPVISQAPQTLSNSELNCSEDSDPDC